MRYFEIFLKPTFYRDMARVQIINYYLFQINKINIFVEN